MMRNIILIFAIFLIRGSLGAQSYHLPDGHLGYHVVDRIDILSGGLPEIHTSIKYYTRKELSELASQNWPLSEKDKVDLDYLAIDNKGSWPEGKMKTKTEYSLDKQYVDSTGLFYTLEDGLNSNSALNTTTNTRNGLLGYFYKSSANFYEVHTENFNLYVNPILNLNFGKDSDNDNLIFQNTRGIELRGDIDDRAYFYTNIYENQASFNDYHDARIIKFKTIPGQSLYKNFTSSVSDKFKGYDFLNSSGYLGFNVSKSIALEIGHGKHFYGNGYRSILLSNNATNMFYFKFILNVWKFNYQTIFAELEATSPRNNLGDVLLPKKYMASHFLSFKPRKNIEIGLFETVVFSREDHFEFQYLNPVIFYRTIEQAIGSPDNVILGLNMKWNAFKKFSFYSQFVLDEFLLSAIKDGSGWWANKYGLQLGLKYMNVLNVDHLDAQIEYNVVRPFTYSHNGTIEDLAIPVSLANYSHQNQSLVHPLGSNFREVIFLLRYQPVKKLFLNGRFIFSQYGEDTAGTNWGSNILAPSDTRQQDFGNAVGQGERVDVQLIGLDASYMFYHNYFLDLKLMMRTQTSDAQQFLFETNYVSFGLRVNTANLNIDY